MPSWMDTYSTYTSRADDYKEGLQYTGGGATHEIPALRPALTNTRLPEEGTGAIQAIDPQTGAIRWRFPMTDVTDSGVLATAADLVFAGGREGYFYGLDAHNGKVLWKAMVGGQVSAGPMSFSISGKQYVSIAAGNVLLTFALRD